MHLLSANMAYSQYELSISWRRFGYYDRCCGRMTRYEGGNERRIGGDSFVKAQLEIQSLVVRCGTRAVRMENQSLTAGDCLLLTGANGVGKTSLLRALAGLRLAEVCVVRWRGRVHAMTDAEWAAMFSYIGHDNAMKRELTCAENLAFYAALKKRVAKVDAVVGAATRFGVRHCLERRCSALSAGQMRRLSLCRLLVERAPIWLLDEPTTALDGEAQDALNVCITDHLAAGGIAVIATHAPLYLNRDVQTLRLSEASAHTDRLPNAGGSAAC